MISRELLGRHGLSPVQLYLPAAYFQSRDIISASLIGTIFRSLHWSAPGVSQLGGCSCKVAPWAQTPTMTCPAKSSAAIVEIDMNSACVQLSSKTFLLIGDLDTTLRTCPTLRACSKQDAIVESSLELYTNVHDEHQPRSEAEVNADS
eukprot:TRINITY_DN20083_c0_g1_i1.p2 TRINITY_DN20083_c0_g1~~TRINITY_DN20083_c0_g1_i1.p2  ORF type:complete len:148 (+),score=11.93 TRINITY_DN20083_c0_g1_i1:1572-2015(+)